MVLLTQVPPVQMLGDEPVHQVLTDEAVEPRFDQVLGGGPIVPGHAWAGGT